MDAFSRPWLLARLATGALAAVLCVLALGVAVRVLRHWRLGATSEGQLALERRAELVATLVQVALLVSLGGLALTVLAADRSAQSIRGAMCAWGVFESTGVGFLPVATSALAAFGCALWLVVHRLDLRLERPVLTRAKFAALHVVTPLVVLDLVTFGVFAAQLDFDVVASCCSVSLDGGAPVRTGAGMGPGATLFVAALALSAGAAALLFANARRPSRGLSFASAVASVPAAGLALGATLLYVAPHAYELPHHRCPFCLLHAHVGGIGWPLFGGLFAATVLGVGTGLVAALRNRAGEPTQVDASLGTLGRLGAFGWLVVLVTLAFPVASYWLRTGASVFG
ncbi:MAG: hypothetical protein H6721_01840 [Sandaracinus sp.]|nr:hypothetical protein [Sandaracinus sp.]MCB9611190.1 hypothetical protein [Sandaracinus sp.]MCB9621058.1 hypothetical protein [Sandaracinus sp.]MCB9623723.1 hypothetical protein [Sandaracinus sp.]MCB9630884.1 hypothetical protein [Sandaracinus sp.]